MNLRFVEAFYWVATLKSVSRAAEKLCITQSAMSSRIAALEEELGVMLLDRRDKQFRLTLAGSRLLTQAEKLLALQREIKLEMGTSGGVEPRAVPLRLGAIESVLHSWLVPWIEALRAEHPEMELELSVETTPVLAEMARRGTLDLVLNAAPAAQDGVRVRPLPPMEMVFVGNKKLHIRRRYTLEQLGEYDLLTFQRGSQPHVALVDLYRQSGNQPRKLHTISSISAMTQLVEAGFGVATLPRAAAERLVMHRDLTILRCETTLMPLPVYASYRVDPAAMDIEAVVRSIVSHVQGTAKNKARRAGAGRAGKSGAGAQLKASD